MDTSGQEPLDTILRPMSDLIGRINVFWVLQPNGGSNIRESSRLE